MGLFPFDFGSIPGTVAADGDPVDALVLTDEPTFVGCLVEARHLGELKLIKRRTENERNDRLIAVASESHTRLPEFVVPRLQLAPY